jgi:hypothetical protein
MRAMRGMLTGEGEDSRRIKRNKGSWRGEVYSQGPKMCLQMSYPNVMESKPVKGEKGEKNIKDDFKWEERSELLRIAEKNF